ncbi:MAG: GSCFA domain-containing protein [Paramuribaculum sp.]|nr:GSCFA domain-containing protein [Paramuribaculum sp.]
MDFRTIIKPLDFAGTLNHTTPMMLLGSCFSDNIGQRLKQRLFPVMVNPFGTLYNPASILAVLRRITSDDEFSAEELFLHQGLYRNFLCHSSLSGTEAEITLATMNQRLHDASRFLQSASAIFLTFGTAWVFRHNKSGIIVANCHKLPAYEFTRSILSIAQATENITQIVTEIRRINNNAKIFFSVSPIRHLADGAHGNQISKSTLLMAVDSVISSTSDITYIPAYEILNDDLRDYRFYEADMCHPSGVASDYVFDYISNSFFDSETKNLAQKCAKFTAMHSHRILSDDRISKDAHNSLLELKRHELLTAYPQLSMSLKLFNL